MKKPKLSPEELQSILDEVEYEVDQAARAEKNLQRVADRIRNAIEGR